MAYLRLPPRNVHFLPTSRHRMHRVEYEWRGGYVLADFYRDSPVKSWLGPFRFNKIEKRY